MTSGVPGLDKMIEGGFVKGSSVLLSGTPGSGKTTLAMQFLIEGALNAGEPSIFISFEEGLELIRENFIRFGWSIDDLERQGKLVLVQKDATLVGALLENELGQLQEILERVGAKRVVIDSVSVMNESSDKVDRQTLAQLVDFLRSKGCTTLFIHERSVAAVDEIKYEAIDFLFDGIILLSRMRTGNSFRQILRVPKMRYTKIMPKIVPVQISDKGVAVYPEMSVFE